MDSRPPLGPRPGSSCNTTRPAKPSKAPSGSQAAGTSAGNSVGKGAGNSAGYPRPRACAGARHTAPTAASTTLAHTSAASRATAQGRLLPSGQGAQTSATSRPPKPSACRRGPSASGLAWAGVDVRVALAMWGGRVDAREADNKKPAPVAWAGLWACGVYAGGAAQMPCGSGVQLRLGGRTGGTSTVMGPPTGMTVGAGVAATATTATAVAPTTLATLVTVAAEAPVARPTARRPAEIAAVRLVVMVWLDT